jgi:hypothetical protein
VNEVADDGKTSGLIASQRPFAAANLMWLGSAWITGWRRENGGVARIRGVGGKGSP